MFMKLYYKINIMGIDTLITFIYAQTMTLHIVKDTKHDLK